MGAPMTVELLRVAVYRRFAETGQAPTAADLAEKLGVAEALVRAGLRDLAAGRHLVLDDQDRIRISGWPTPRPSGRLPRTLGGRRPSAGGGPGRGVTTDTISPWR